MKNLLKEFIGRYASSMYKNMGTNKNLIFTNKVNQNFPIAKLRPHASQNDVNSISDKKQAAVVLIFSKNKDKILSVSRKNDKSKIGLPGGKVDPGETVEQAAVRELKEETGLNVVSMKKVFTNQDTGHYETTTFLCKVNGYIETNEAGVIRWVTKDDLINPDKSPFAKYNILLFDKLNLI